MLYPSIFVQPRRHSRAGGNPAAVYILASKRNGTLYTGRFSNRYCKRKGNKKMEPSMENESY